MAAAKTTKKTGKPAATSRAKKTIPRNERNTENLVRDALRRLGYYKNPQLHIEEQSSSIAAIKQLLRTGSKRGTGTGHPEFLISSLSAPDIIVLIECKAAPGDHVSPLLSNSINAEVSAEGEEARARRLSKYAVDGVLHYAKLLSREFHVVAIAVSGETASSSQVSTYLHSKGAAAPRLLVTPEGNTVKTLIPWDDYAAYATFDPEVRQIRYDELMQFARDLHEFMRDHAKLTESEKPLLVSGTLIALRNKAFANSYNFYSPEELQKAWMRVIREELNNATIPKAKKDSMTQPYTSIAVHPELGKATRSYPKGALHELVRRIHEKAAPFISASQDLDILGQFYGEFLKYTGGDKKALGIVLTPRHITELFALLANVNKKSTVLDICAGTGGFLISAMSQMMRDATTKAERERIKQHGLVGVEQQPNMFALAASNMILRGDGKANLYQGNCFKDTITREIKQKRATVGMINPPFSQTDADLHELRFIKHMLDCLRPGSFGIAIAPISCAIAPHDAKRELLQEHTLEAVMSMPAELFYPVGVVSCVMVFTAHRPHEESAKKTWFGYWKDDGFIKTKHRGRVDLYGRWPAIRDHWVEMFRNREVHPGESVLQFVEANDEWCAEAYLETDYSSLSKEDFEEEIKKYIVFQIVNGLEVKEEVDDDSVE